MFACDCTAQLLLTFQSQTRDTILLLSVGYTLLKLDITRSKCIIIHIHRHRKTDIFCHLTLVFSSHAQTDNSFSVPCKPSIIFTRMRMQKKRKNTQKNNIQQKTRSANSFVCLSVYVCVFSVNYNYNCSVVIQHKKFSVKARQMMWKNDGGGGEIII